MNGREDFGYDKERFPALLGESFDCIICSLVVRDPKECTSCGSMFCKACIDGWLQKKKECPNRCPVTQSSIKPIGKALLRIYNDLDVRCKYYDTCKQIIKLSDLDDHEAVCNLPKCVNYDVCKNNIKLNMKELGVCDQTCLLLSKIRVANGDWDKVHKEIQTFLKQYAVTSPATGNVGGGTTVVSSGGGLGVTNFKWDAVNIGTNIELSNGGKTAFLREGPYMFRTIIGDTPFYNGVHYWEILGDARTENELKIGVATKKEFNYNSAFCDYEFGFSYYGLGQLRHNSNASGPSYGKRFKKEGTLGVFLDMNRGILSFALNGEHFGPAYTSEALKKGPIYPAISLLHCAGLTLVTGNKAPDYFFK